MKAWDRSKYKMGKTKAFLIFILLLMFIFIPTTVESPNCISIYERNFKWSYHVMGRQHPIRQFILSKKTSVLG